MEFDPYVYPGTNVLKNRADILDNDALARFERIVTIERQAAGLPSVSLTAQGFCALHHHLFQHVYPWAGLYREVNISKGNDLFCVYGFIEPQMRTVFKSIQAENNLRNLERANFAARASHYLSELNAIHPFREGNGRTMRAFLVVLGQEAGHHIDLTHIRPEPWNEASRQSFRTGDLTLLREEVERSIFTPQREQETQREKPDNRAENKSEATPVAMQLKQPEQPARADADRLADTQTPISTPDQDLQKSRQYPEEAKIAPPINTHFSPDKGIEQPKNDPQQSKLPERSMPSPETNKPPPEQTPPRIEESKQPPQVQSGQTREPATERAAAVVKSRVEEGPRQEPPRREAGTPPRDSQPRPAPSRDQERGSAEVAKVEAARPAVEATKRPQREEAPQRPRPFPSAERTQLAEPPRSPDSSRQAREQPVLPSTRDHNAQPKREAEAPRAVKATEAVQQAFRQAAKPLPERPQPTRAEVPREAVNRLHAASQARAAPQAQRDQLRPEQARTFDAPRALSERLWGGRQEAAQRGERPTNTRGETTDRRAEQSERSREQSDAKRARTDAAAFREAVDAHARSRAENRGRDRDGGRDRDR